MSGGIQIGFKPQGGPQQAYVSSPVDVTVFGGARGGGKTFGSLGDFWIHAEDYGSAAVGLMVRKTKEDLKDTIEIAKSMYGNVAAWSTKGSYFQFKNGAKFYFAYLETDKDAENYQGWSLTRLYIEEMTQYPAPGPIMKLLAALRSPHGVPCQMKATCNPGGPGHHWVKSWAIDLGAYQPFTDPKTGLTRIYIPSRIQDNPALLANDPTYINRLKSAGSEQLVRAWLEGDWDVIEGAFFPEYHRARHVVAPFVIPAEWTRFRSMDWGSAKPFSVGWWAVVQDEFQAGHTLLPRGAIVRYREWYGMKPGEPDVGLKLPADAVAKGIVSRETRDDVRERISYGVLDPAAFAVVSGPSIAETMMRQGVTFRRADNTRTTRDKRMGGWDQVRARLVGNGDGQPMMFFFETCRDTLRTLPMMQHDTNRPEDLDTDGEDHAVDDVRYACLSRPFLARTVSREDRNPYLVANAFKLHNLR